MKKKIFLIIGLVCFFLFGFGSGSSFAQEEPMPSMRVEGYRDGFRVEPKPFEPFQFRSVFGKEPEVDISAFGQAAGAAVSNNLVEVIINTQIYPAIRDEIIQFVADLQADGYRVYVDTISGGTIWDVRGLIQKRFAEGLVGTILVGDFPVPWFEIYNDFGYGSRVVFPSDLFYMDLDGEWSDSDHNGFLDIHQGNTDPEIWLGRLTFSALKPYGDEIALLKSYFWKNHQWRTNWSAYKNGKKSALLYVDDDWADYVVSGNPSVVQSLESLYYVDLFSDSLQTTANDYLQKLQQPYEFVSLWAHSSIANHSFKPWWSGNKYIGTSIETVDIFSVKPQAYFYNLFACESLNYTGQFDPSDSSGIILPYIGGAYIASGNGLWAVGTTKAGGMWNQQVFYGILADGENFGQSFLNWWSVTRHNWYASDESGFRSWFYGMTMLGDPTLRLVDKPEMNVSANVAALTVDVPQKNLTIRVSDSKGLPIIGAAVNLSGGGISLNGSTGKNGQVTFKTVITALANGEIIVMVQKDGYQTAEISIPVQMAKFKVVVTITGRPGKPKTVSVTVKNAGH